MKNSALAVGCLIASRVATAQSKPTPPELSAFEQTIRLAKAGLPHVQALIPWLVALLVGTILLAAASSIIQVFNKPWVKPVTVVLGAAVTLIGAMKAAFFAIDYATCAQTLSDMQGIIQQAETNIQNYEKPGLEGYQDQYYKQIEGEIDTLRKLDNLLRASGHGTLPPAFITVVYAQAQGQNPYATIRETGSVIASSQKAGYDFARYQALEIIARERLKTPDVQLDAMIQYLNKFAQPGAANCSPAEHQMFKCDFELSLTALYLNSAVVERFAGAPAARPETVITGNNMVNLPNDPVWLFSVSKSGKLGEKGFQFNLVKDPKTSEWEIRSISSDFDGLWSFEFSSGGATALLPVKLYHNAHPGYQLTPPYPLHLSSKSALTVEAYQPKP